MSPTRQSQDLWLPKSREVASTVFSKQLINSKGDLTEQSDSSLSENSWNDDLYLNLKYLGLENDSKSNKNAGAHS